MSSQKGQVAEGMKEYLWQDPIFAKYWQVTEQGQLSVSIRGAYTKCSGLG